MERNLLIQLSFIFRTKLSASAYYIKIVLIQIRDNHVESFEIYSKWASSFRVFLE